MCCFCCRTKCWQWFDYILEFLPFEQVVVVDPTNGPGTLLLVAIGIGATQFVRTTLDTCYPLHLNSSHQAKQTPIGLPWQSRAGHWQQSVIVPPKVKGQRPIQDRSGKFSLSIYKLGRSGKFRSHHHSSLIINHSSWVYNILVIAFASHIYDKPMERPILMHPPWVP